ncbi:MAG: TraR/DksA C4-type zinc finger protein [Deltaproteobacteria bacterium]|nr:TraR/DksA C4-type zinc finger protein [Deltaproteobacteria bacterium]
MNHSDPREEIKGLLREGDLRSLLIQAASLHGHYCPGLAYGVKAGHVGLSRLGLDNTGMEELIAVVECNNCFVDGVQMSTGCSIGNNALVYKDLGKTAVTILSRRTKAALRIVLKPRRWEAETLSDREKEARDLFRRVVKERQDDPEAARRMRELWVELSFETVEKPAEDLFDVHEVPAVFPEYAPIFDSALCSACGEELMETRAALRAGEPTCLACAGEDCFAVLGRGIRILAGGALR